MALPILLIGAALATGGYGIKKSINAKDDFDAAKKANREANEIYDSAKEDLSQKRESAQNALETLGKTKFEIYEHSIIPFAEAFNKIKNIEFKELNLNGESISPPDLHQISKLCESSLEVKEIVSGGISALGAGGLAGFAAYGSVGALASASTGTAIGTLSGAAATNATLAWLGGGSLASGGLGMAGGTAVLGGIVAGPVLAVGGMMLASKAEAAKNDAYANKIKAELAAEEMKTASMITHEIDVQFQEMNELLTKINLLFTPLFAAFTRLTNRSTNYQDYSEAEKKGVYVTVSTIQMLKILLDTPILNSNGLPTQQSKEITNLAPELYNEVEHASLPVIQSL